MTSVGGVTVSMVAFQAVDPGSTPGRRTFFILNHFDMKLSLINSSPRDQDRIPMPISGKSYVRRPGVEPGSTAWKATMLTVTPPTLRWEGQV